MAVTLAAAEENGRSDKRRRLLRTKDGGDGCCRRAMTASTRGSGDGIQEIAIMTITHTRDGVAVGQEDAQTAYMANMAALAMAADKEGKGITASWP